MATSPPPSTSRIRPAIGRRRPRQSLQRGALRGRDPCGGRRAGRVGSARRPDRQAHRPLAQGQVHRPRAVERVEDLVGRRQPAHLRGALRPAQGSARSPTLAERDLYVQDCSVGAHPDHRRSLRVYTETAWASIFARNLFRRPTADELAAFQPNFTIIDVPSFKADPDTEGTRTGDGDPAPPRADGDPHRRDRVRRRDQEVRLHGHELPAARRGRAADALGGQRRRSGRFGRLLRAVGHRQDDALGRPEAEPHRRRRARLGSGRRLQLRGRLLRQDDPALVRSTSPTSSRPRSASGRSSRTSTSTRPPGARPRLGARSPRTPAAPTRSTSSGMRIRPGMAGHPRNLVLLTADAFGVLPPISRLTHEQATYHFLSAATPPSWPAPRSGSRSRRRPSRPASGRRSCPATRASTRGCSVERMERWAPRPGS